jgi:hypothetical protein
VNRLLLVLKEENVLDEIYRKAGKMDSECFASIWTPEELEQLTQACEPASFGVKQEDVLDETYRKAGKMDSECFSSMLDPSNTDLMKIVRGYLLEGLNSQKGIKAELYKLNVYGTHLIFVHSGIWYYAPSR